MGSEFHPMFPAQHSTYHCTKNKEIKKSQVNGAEKCYQTQLESRISNKWSLKVLWSYSSEGRRIFKTGAQNILSCRKF